jgi:hypothetical protein
MVISFNIAINLGDPRRQPASTHNYHRALRVASLFAYCAFVVNEHGSGSDRRRCVFYRAILLLSFAVVAGRSENLYQMRSFAGPPPAPAGELWNCWDFWWSCLLSQPSQELLGCTSGNTLGLS